MTFPTPFFFVGRGVVSHIVEKGLKNRFKKCTDLRIYHSTVIFLCCHGFASNVRNVDSTHENCTTMYPEDVRLDVTTSETAEEFGKHFEISLVHTNLIACPRAVFLRANRNEHLNSDAMKKGSINTPVAALELQLLQWL